MTLRSRRHQGVSRRYGSRSTIRQCPRGRPQKWRAAAPHSWLQISMSSRHSSPSRNSASPSRKRARCQGLPSHSGAFEQNADYATSLQSVCHLGEGTFPANRSPGSDTEPDQRPVDPTAGRPYGQAASPQCPRGIPRARARIAPHSRQPGHTPSTMRFYYGRRLRCCTKALQNADAPNVDILAIALLSEPLRVTTKFGGLGLEQYILRRCAETFAKRQPIPS